MAKKQRQFSSLKELGKLLPKDTRQKAVADERFRKEEEYLRGELGYARSRRNRRSELISLTKLGKLYRDNGDYDQAIEHYEQAFKIDKEDFYTLDGLGMTYYRMGEYDKAIEWFQRELNPVVAMNNLSRAYRAKGDYDRAIEYAEGVIKKDPEHPMAMNELGINYRRKRDYHQSIVWFEQLLKIEPRNKQAMDGLGITYREMGDYQQAIACFEKKLKRYPNDKEALDGLGITYQEMGEYEQAIAWFEKKLRVYPNDKQSLDGLGITYRGMGDHQQAIVWFEKKLKRYPNDKQALNGLGITYRELADYDQAIAWFEKTLKRYPNDKQALNGLGIIYREIGDYDQAIAWFEKKLKLYPNDKQALNGLGIIYREIGDYDQAIAWFEKELKLYPNDQHALDGLGITYRERDSQLETISTKYESEGKLEEAKQILDFLHEIQAEPIFPRLPQETVPEVKEESLEEKIARLERAIQQQEELLRSRRLSTLGVMASGLAHEIAQPLQLILAVSQNCIRDIQSKTIDTEGTLADLERIATTTRRIDKIVNHLHVLSRERKPKLEAVDVNSVIENSFIMFHQQLKSRSIKVERDFTDDLPPVKADTVQLEQVFINLINNAREALEEVEDKTIIISTQAQNSQVQIRFQDNGKGIDPADSPQIFDAFVTTKEEGVGLGLYITRDIIHSYGGTITAQSDGNEGTTFLIQLPIAEEEETE